MAYEARTRRGGFERPQRAEPIAMLGRGRVVLVLATSLVAVMAYFRSTNSPEIAGTSADASLSMAQQIAFSQRAAPFFATQHGGLADEETQRELSQLGLHLIRQSGLNVQGREFRFLALADAQQPRLYALPGGTVLITSAMIQRLESPGEKAAVLAHAIGQEMTGSFLTSLRSHEVVPGVAANDVLREIDPSNQSTLDTDRVRRLVETALQVVPTAAQIDVADRNMLQILSHAGYHPDSMIRAWEKLLAGENNIQQVTYRQSSSDRIERMRADVQRLYPNGIPDTLLR